MSKPLTTAKNMTLTTAKNMTLTTAKNKGLLYPELSYEIVGCAFRVHKLFGTGHKESVYQEAFENELKRSQILFRREPPIKVSDPTTGKIMRSCYRPDFLADNKIIIEIKAVPSVTRYFLGQLHDYLHNSDYELGYLINFAEIYLKPIRVIYSNEKKLNAITKKS